MSLSFEHLSLVLGQWLQPVIQQLPPSLQNILLNPLAPKAFLVVLALALLRLTNRALTSWSLNNGESVGKWNADRELVLLTGGCSGIGKQMVLDLAKTGTRVVILDIQEPTFSLPSGVTFYKADITSSTSIAEVAEKIRATQGDPTILINNAGVGHDGTILEKPEAKIRQSFEVNTVSHFLMVREFLPSMIAKNHGHIITIASMASFIGLGDMVEYSCTKASALAFHEGLRQELRLWYKAPKVRTTIVHPLWVRTPMIQVLTDAGSEFKQPILTPEMVSEAVVKQVVSQRSGQIILPSYYTPLSMLRALPNWFQEFVRGVGSRDFIKLREWQQKQLKEQ
ncbi:hypothetical protein ASPVEDRAFT_143698 [Aspergillus versicolor CBS 583.65]|uniref:Short-chain dehydrogenase/reductase 3 n=1 Tax=Aspergillus versicolor CBS 583.65 TaxID=1036611 RepID=A0A1L9Q3S7_ASPVE|nr:uncharacterized protein ASPVEDRAFT_143698 [Aspergillus versicolor CBS 583.65]OJJ08420.1 hypothetical protein ASPVEDRAFT_143698 [Aspergillus versicolor CBS 583.65]